MGLPTPSPLGRLMTLTAAHISSVPWPSCSQTRGLKVPWQPRSRRTNVCCSGSVLSKTFAPVNQALSQGLCPGQGTNSLLHLSSPGKHHLSAA